MSFDTPYVPAQTAPSRLDDWYDSTRSSPVRGVLESPVNAAEPSNGLPDGERDSTFEPTIEPAPDSAFESGSSADPRPADNAPPSRASDNTASPEAPADNAPQIDELLRNLPEAPEDASLIDSSTKDLRVKPQAASSSPRSSQS